MKKCLIAVLAVLIIFNLAYPSFAAPKKSPPHRTADNVSVEKSDTAGTKAMGKTSKAQKVPPARPNGVTKENTTTVT